MTDRDSNHPEKIDTTTDIPPHNEAVLRDEEVAISDEETGETEEEVTDPFLSPEDLRCQLDEKDRELTIAKEKYLRSLADMDNLRKRCRRDIEDARFKGMTLVLEELLPALDSIDMALSSIAPDSSCQAVYDGILMIRRQFLSAMDRFDLKAIRAQGQKFDPSLHEAVAYVPSIECDIGHIIRDMRTGYTLGERLLRPSMVQVSSGPPSVPEGDDTTTSTEPETTDTSSAPPETAALDGSDEPVPSEADPDNTNPDDEVTDVH